MADTSAGSVAAARQELRKLSEQVVQHKAEATSTRSNYLGKALDQSNKLYEVLKNDARGAALDASSLSTISALGAEQAGNLDRATPERYISRLKAKFGFRNDSTKLKWTELADAIREAQVFTLPPAPTFLDGRFDAPEKKARQKKEKRAREPDVPQETADNTNVSDLQENAENKAQTVRMNHLQGVIKKEAKESAARGGPKRVSLFQVLLHPTSFSQTVENFFDLAFLIKMGTARITTDADGPYLSPEKKPDVDDFKGGLTKVQNILKVDYATYRQLVSRWCTPDRPPLLVDRDQVVERPTEAGADRNKKARSS